MYYLGFCILHLHCILLSHPHDPPNWLDYTDFSAEAASRAALQTSYLLVQAFHLMLYLTHDRHCFQYS